MGIQDCMEEDEIFPFLSMKDQNLKIRKDSGFEGWPYKPG